MARVTVVQSKIALRQNEDMRRISAWAAIALVPTAIAGIYGMNFDHMPELRWRFGYLLVLDVIGPRASACIACSDATAGSDCHSGLFEHQLEGLEFRGHAPSHRELPDHGSEGVDLPLACGGASSRPWSSCPIAVQE